MSFVLWEVPEEAPLVFTPGIHLAWYRPDCERCIPKDAWPEGSGPLVILGPKVHLHRCHWCDALFLARGSTHEFCSNAHRSTFHNKMRLPRSGMKRGRVSKFPAKAKNGLHPARSKRENLG